MEQEIWKCIEGFSGYQISSFGRLKSLKFGKEIILKQRIGTNGYSIVNLCINNKINTVSIHRLVALNFIENCENKSEVNHINGNKSNNNVSNLEWVTHKENINHAIIYGLRNNFNLLMKKAWSDGKFKNVSKAVSEGNKKAWADGRMIKNKKNLIKMNKERSKKIYSKKLNMTFDSIKDAALFINNKYSNGNNFNSIRIAIGLLLNSKRIDSMYNYGWSYITK